MRKSAAGIVAFTCARCVVAAYYSIFFLYVLGTDECGNFRMLVVVRLMLLNMIASSSQ